MSTTWNNEDTAALAALTRAAADHAETLRLLTQAWLDRPAATAAASLAPPAVRRGLASLIPDGEQVAARIG